MINMFTTDKFLLSRTGCFLEVVVHLVIRVLLRFHLDQFERVLQAPRQHALPGDHMTRCRAAAHQQLHLRLHLLQKRQPALHLPEAPLIVRVEVEDEAMN